MPVEPVPVNDHRPRDRRAMNFRLRPGSLALRLGGLLALAAASTATEPAADPLIRIHVQSFTGSTGATVAALVKADLFASGAFALTQEPADALIVGGTVTGSRLEGRLTDAGGTERLRNMYDGPDLRRGAHELADDVVFALTGRPGIATSRLAFVSDVTGRPEIFVCEADGREKRRVTYDGTLASHPSIDRTGTLLTYTSHRGGQADLISLDLMTGARRALVNAPGGNHGACLSPDGRHLALSMAENGWPEIVTMALDGSGRRRLSHRGWVPSSPTWSPDGRRVVFTGDAGDGNGPQLFDARPGRPARRLRLGVSVAYSPDWSPDGERLVFVTRHRDESWLAVWEQGAARVRLLGPGQDPCWGADSRHLLFSTGDRLVTLHTETGHRQTVVENLGRLSEPSWTK
jgi:TolB protein